MQPSPGVLSDLESSAVVADDAVGNAQAQSGSPLCESGGEERIEYLREVVGLNAATVVVDLEPDPAFIHFAMQGNLCASFLGLDRIANQIHNGLLDLQRIHLDQWPKRTSLEDHQGTPRFGVTAH